MRRASRHLAGLIAVISLLAFAGPARAQTTYFWNPATGSGPWSRLPGDNPIWGTAAGGPYTTSYVSEPFVTTANATFQQGNLPGGTTATLSGTDIVVNQLTFNTATGTGSNTYTLTGANLVFQGAAQAVTVNASVTATISTSITLVDTGLTVNGAGVLVLNTTNSYDAPTTVTGGGTLQISADDRLGATTAGAGRLVLNNGTLRTTAGFTLNAGRGIALGPTAGAGAGTIQVNTGTLTYTGVMANNGGGTGGLVKTGAGTLTLGGASTYDGPTTITAGVLAVNALANGGTASPIGDSSNASTNLVFGGGTLRYTGGTTSTNRGFTANSTAIIDVSTAGTTLTVSGVGTGAGGLTKIGTGTLVLSGANDYDGTTTITAGTLSVATLPNGGVAGPIGDSPSASGNLVLNGGTLAYTGATASTDRGFTLSAISTISVTTAGTVLTVSGVGTGAGGLTKTGDGTLALAGANNYTGTTTVSAGTLRLDGDALADASNVVNNSVLTFNPTAGITYNGNVSGTGAVNVAASGGNTVTLGGNNTYSGATAVDTGATLIASSVTALSPNSAFTVNGSLDLSTVTATIGSLAGGGIVAPAGPATLTTNGNNTSTTFSGTLVGPIALTKVGSGTLTLSGANSHTGGTTVNAGTLALGASDVLPNGSPVTLAGTSTLQMNGNSDQAGVLNVTDNPTIALTPGDNTQTLRFTGIGTNTGALTINGWTGGFPNGTGTSGRIIFDSNANFTQPFLDAVQFAGYPTGASLVDIGGGQFELVPVPEPGTVVGIAAAGLGLVGLVRRARRRTA